MRTVPGAPSADEPSSELSSPGIGEVKELHVPFTRVVKIVRVISVTPVKQTCDLPVTCQTNLSPPSSTRRRDNHCEIVAVAFLGLAGAVVVGLRGISVASVGASVGMSVVSAMVAKGHCDTGTR